jgi:cell division protein FtsQ
MGLILVRARIAGSEKALRFIARGLILIAATAGAVSVGRLLEQHVRSAKAFATANIEVSGLSRLSRTEVLATAGLAIGQNVFAVSPEQARASLTAHPWVSSAVVTRRLPATYRIEVHEQRATALLLLETLYLVSEDGTVFKKVEPDDAVDLPLITGVDAAQFRADLEFRTTLLTTAVGLLHDYRDVGLWKREAIAEIHAEPDEGVTLYVGKDAMQVRLGQRPFRKKLRRFGEIIDELRGNATRPAYVYLDNVRRPDRVAVRLR